MTDYVIQYYFGVGSPSNPSDGHFVEEKYSAANFAAAMLHAKNQIGQDVFTVPFDENHARLVRSEMVTYVYVGPKPGGSPRAA